MLFLSEGEKQQWSELGADILANRSKPGSLDADIRSDLVSAFHCFVGARLAAEGQEALGKEWLFAGMPYEEDGLFLNAFMTAFLERQNDRFIMPEVCFADPRPFVHLTTVPSFKSARENFLKHCERTMPDFSGPIRIVDLGTGSGVMLVAFLKHLRKVGKISDVAEIVLVDASRGMVELAEKTVAEDFPPSVIRTVNSPIQDFAARIDTKFDIALSSLAYHHMPSEAKLIHMKQLRPWIDHFVICELDADTDTPELHSPELALAVYQVYGRLMDDVFAHDAPIAIAQACIDCFLMVETVSFFTQPRGARTDYHMLRYQWRRIFDEGLGPEFTCWCDSICSSDEYFGLFTMHYGR